MCASQLQKCWYNQTNVLKGLVRCFPLSPSVLKRKEKKSHQNKLKCLGKDSAYSMSVHSCKLGAAFGLQFCKVNHRYLGPQKHHALVKSMLIC